MPIKSHNNFEELKEKWRVMRRDPDLVQSWYLTKDQRGDLGINIFVRPKDSNDETVENWNAPDWQSPRQ